MIINSILLRSLAILLCLFNKYKCCKYNWKKKIIEIFLDFPTSGTRRRRRLPFPSKRSLRFFPFFPRLLRLHTNCNNCRFLGWWSFCVPVVENDKLLKLSANALALQIVSFTFYGNWNWWGGSNDRRLKETERWRTTTTKLHFFLFIRTRFFRLRLDVLKILVVFRLKRS